MIFIYLFVLIINILLKLNYEFKLVGEGSVVSLSNL